MFRVANVVMIVALLVTAAVVYQLKYASTAEAERLATLRASIRKERDAISLMKAEWARRTSPIYIQGLVERHLDMKRLDVDSISSLDDLPEKPAGNGDGIGGMIEALVDAPLVTSSAGSKPSAATTGSGAASVPATSALRPANAPVSRPPASAAAGPTPRPPAPRAAPVIQQAPAAPPPAAAPAPQPELNPLERLLPPGFMAGWH